MHLLNKDYQKMAHNISQVDVLSLEDIWQRFSLTYFPLAFFFHFCVLILQTVLKPHFTKHLYLFSKGIQCNFARILDII